MDQATYCYNKDITLFTRQYLTATPQSDPAIYRKTYPISYIGWAKTRTLILQGSVYTASLLPKSLQRE